MKHALKTHCANLGSKIRQVQVGSTSIQLVLTQMTRYIK